MMDLTIDGVDGQVARTSSGDCGGCETLHDVHHVNDIISRDEISSEELWAQFPEANHDIWLLKS